MTGMVMTYLLVVSVVVSVAVWIADEGLRRAGAQTRWLWLLALAAGPLLLVTGAVLPPESVSAMSGAVPGDFVFELPGLVVGGEDTAFPWMTFLGAAWLISSVVMLGIVVRAHLRLHAEKREWSTQEVDGRGVYVSRNRGPAVAGFVTCSRSTICGAKGSTTHAARRTGR